MNKKTETPRTRVFDWVEDPKTTPLRPRTALDELSDMLRDPILANGILEELQRRGFRIEAEAAPDLRAALERIAIEGWERSREPGDDAAVLAAIADAALAAPAAGGLGVLARIENRTKPLDIDASGRPNYTSLGPPRVQQIHELVRSLLPEPSREPGEER